MKALLIATLLIATGAPVAAQDAVPLDEDRNSAAIAEGRPDPDFAGHYYLSGIRETGSEMKLNADGSFAWYMAYGAVDQFAEGRWVRDGHFLVLHVPLDKNKQQLPSAGKRYPWNATAEQGLVQAQHEDAEERVRARCYYVTYPASMTQAAASALPSEAKPDPNILKHRLQVATAAAKQARSKAEQAVAKAAAQSGEDAAIADAALDAMRTWEMANGQVMQAESAAGLPATGLPWPEIPSACSLPPAPGSDPIPEAKWQRGIQVRMIDPEQNSNYRNIEITLIYADGATQSAPLRKSDGAYFPLRKGISAMAAQLQANWLQQGEPVSVPIPPIEEGVQILQLPISALYRPPFEYMRLKIEGDQLRPDLFPRGTYTRASSRNDVK